MHVFRNKTAFALRTGVQQEPKVQTQEEEVKHMQVVAAHTGLEGRSK